MLDISPLAATPAAALERAREHSPYLGRLMRTQADTFAELAVRTPDALLDDVLDQVRSVAKLDDEQDAMRGLREGKQRAHMVLSGADLCGAWPVMKVTEAMTRFADTAAAAALGFAARRAGLETRGLFLVALGKMGAHELNYSSDIDIAAFYDPDVFEGGERGPSDAASRLIRHMTKLLEERTGDGYVLRTDLRLRPDPRSTPVAISTNMADIYYESVGQNWERMVWIKARGFAGDLDCAAEFLNSMQSFVWRQHLDYWAINDIHSIKAMINSAKGHAGLDVPHADVKLGPGGIREIEFYAQTQQLILGGRDKSLRSGETLGALQALAQRGAVDDETVARLTACYKILRAVEHRVQMRMDEQTHTLPEDVSARAAVASLCGMPDLAGFDTALRSVREDVHEIYLALFGREDRSSDSAMQGNLVFTGVDDDPGTVETLVDIGFADPSEIIETIRHWHRGHTPATRTVRGRELLTALLPELLGDMGETGEPDAAFRYFADFLENLPSGVQTLSMLLAEDDLRRDLVATLALAPRLAGTLGRKPALLEALLQRGLILAPETIAQMSFEEAMDTARLYVRDQGFLIGHDLLHGRVAASRSARAFSDLADWTIGAMAHAAEAECIRRFGPVPGDWCVAAFGRLGGRAMTAASDLDIMVVYDPLADENAQIWFARFTQRLITSLSAQTAEGSLYEVDMRLRPSGRSGPVAVRFSSFQTYHRDEAWTWEHMALTRLRSVVDRGGLGARLQEATRKLIGSARDKAALRQDICDMRQRLAREKPGAGLWDLKLGDGGIVDVEFTVQHGLLSLGEARAAVPDIADAIVLLTEANVFWKDEGAQLLAGHALLSSLQQVQRIALDRNVDPETVSAGLKDRLQRAASVPDFETLVAQLREAKAKIAHIRQRHIGPLRR